METEVEFWSGTMTKHNYQEIAERLQKFLEGKYFTLVEASIRYGELHLEVYPHRYLDPGVLLEKPVNTYDVGGDTWIEVHYDTGGFSFDLSRGLWFEFNEDQVVISGKDPEIKRVIAIESEKES